MKKRLLSLFVAVILSAGLIPYALSSAVFAEGAVINVTNAEELYDALNMKSKVDRINITDSFSVDSDCTIKFDPAHLDYYSDTVVTVEAGVTLTVNNNGTIGSFWPSYVGDWETGPLPNGKLINNGNIVVNDGGEIVADFDENNGSLTINNGGAAVCANVNNGTVAVNSGGYYCTAQGGRSENHGTITVDYSAQMESCFGTTVVNAEDGVMNIFGDFYVGCIGFEEDVMLFENHGTVNGDGGITLYECDPETMPVSDLDALLAKLMEQVGQTTRFDNWDDLNIYREVTVKSFEELAAATSGKRVVAGEAVTADMDTVIIIASDIEIPEGKSISTMATLIVDFDNKLTVSDGAMLECALENYGYVEVLSGGSLATTMNGFIFNAGVMIINEGATVTSQKGGVIVNGPYAGMTLDGTLYCGCLNNGTRDIFWFYNAGDLNGEGTIVLYEAAPDDMPVENMEELADLFYSMINENGESKITIEIGSYFTPGDINNDGVVNNKDVVALFKYVSSGTGNVNMLALDINGDGVVNNKDVVALFKHVSNPDYAISEKPYQPKA